MREDELYSSGIFASELDEDAGEDAPTGEREFGGENLDEDDEDLFGEDDEAEAGDLDGFKADDWN